MKKRLGQMICVMVLFNQIRNTGRFAASIVFFVSQYVCMYVFFSLYPLHICVFCIHCIYYMHCIYCMYCMHYIHHMYYIYCIHCMNCLYSIHCIHCIHCMRCIFVSIGPIICSASTVCILCSNGNALHVSHLTMQ